MATENKGIQPLSDEAIRAFLLGRLDADAQANFEAELIGSDQLEARVRQAELYLTDDFVGHRLDRFDRQRFMKSFLLTAERRRTWLVSNALYDRFSSGRAKTFEIPRSGSLWADFFAFRRLAWKFAFAVTILLLLFGSAWLVKKESKLVDKIIPRRILRRAPAVPTPQEAHHPVNTAPRDHQQSESSPAQHESSLPDSGAAPPEVVAMITLFSDTQAAIKLPGAASGVVRFQLTFAGDRSQPLRIEIKTVEGQAVFTGEAPAVSQQSGTIDFDVPVSSFKADDYRVTVGSEGGQVSARYNFRVQ